MAPPRLRPMVMHFGGRRLGCGSGRELDAPASQKRDCGLPASDERRRSACLGASHLPPALQRRIASSVAIVLRRHAGGSSGAAGLRNA
jgi:hypothetical protein